MKATTDSDKWDIVLSVLNDSQEVFYQDKRVADALKYGKELRAAGGGLRKLLDKRHDEWRDACDERDRALARAEAAITESNSTARRAFSAEVENQRLTKEAAGLRARAEAAEAERDDLRESLDAAEEERNGQAILLADELNDARIEAAEAERDDLRERHDNLKTAYANLVQEAADRLTRMYSAEAEAAGLRARAEAAEAERDDANIAASLNKSRVEEMVDRLSFEMKRREALAARVAELEAQLAAQGWRPVTDDEPEEATEVELLVVGYRDGGNWYYHDDNPVRGWRPLPAPDTQEEAQPGR